MNFYKGNIQLKSSPNDEWRNRSYGLSSRAIEVVLAVSLHHVRIDGVDVSAYSRVAVP